MLFISGTIKTLFFRNPAQEKAKKNILGIVKLLSDIVISLFAQINSVASVSDISDRCKTKMASSSA